MTRWSSRVAFHAIFSLILTFPLALHLGTELPNGTERPGTVAYFNLWTLRWDQQQIGDLFRHYWDAPIFHPTPGAFALSEPQPLTGLVFAPISWLSHNPVLAYNLVLLLALTLNGLAAARLGRRLGVAAAPAALAGVFAQALPFVTNELGVLQLTMLFPMLFLVDALLAWVDAPDVRRGAVIGAWLAATFLTCGYYGLFAVLVFGMAGLALLGSLLLRRRAFFTLRRPAELAAGAAVFALLAGPVLVPQARITDDHPGRSDLAITGNSAAPGDYLRLEDRLPGAKELPIQPNSFAVTGGLPVLRNTPWLQAGRGHERLYPGSALVGLAVAGLVVVWRRDARHRSAVTHSTDPVGAPDRATMAEPAVAGLQAATAAGRPVPQADGSPARDVDESLGPEADEVPVPVPGPRADEVQAPKADEAEPVAAPVAEGEADGDRYRPHRAFLGTAFVVAVLLSLGLRLDLTFAVGDHVFFEHWKPYQLVRNHFPGFKDLRSPFRAAVLVQSLLVPFAALALGALWEKGRALRPAEGLAGRSARVRSGAVWAVVIVALGLLEVAPMPQPLVNAPTIGRGTDWVDWLAQHHDPSFGDDSVAMVPFPASGDYRDYEDTTVAMLAALDHGHPLVNGYSGLFPATYNDLEGAMQTGFPDGRSIDALRDLQVSWLVIDRNWLTEEHEQSLARYDRSLRPAFEGKNRVVYRFDPLAEG